MKIRNGFVSNSSSSSFIIAGIKIKKEDLSDEQREELYDHFLVLNDSDDGVPTGYCVIGKELASSDGDYMEYQELSLDQINVAITEVAEKVNLSGTRGVFTGTRAC